MLKFHSIKMILGIIPILLFVFSCITTKNGQVVVPKSEDGLFDFYIPWDDSSETAINLSRMIIAPAGKDGFVSVSEAGHLQTGNRRIRFWGVNFCFGANFPGKADAVKIAKHLVKFGINIVRFHHMDMNAAPNGIWTNARPERTLDPGQLDKLDFFISELKKNGIYADLNLLVSRQFGRGTELDKDIDNVKNWKTKASIGFFDNAVVGLQQQYARDLLTHKNPYTGTRYVEEPAIAFIEINNENGLVQTYLTGELDALPPHYQTELRSLWNEWLKAKYSGHSALATSWNARSIETGNELLANNDFSSGRITGWNVENHENAQSENTIVDQGPNGTKALRIKVTQPGIEGWHIQLNQGRIPFEANTPYTLVFYGKADAACTISVEANMAHDPWKNLGLRTPVSLTTEWKKYECGPFILDSADTNGRINFTGMGLSIRTFFFAGLSLKKGGVIGLSAEENLDRGTIGIFKRNSPSSRTDEGMKDWFSFLLKQEGKYWSTMHDFVKQDLGAKALMFGTIVGCSTPTLMSEFDGIDTHAYWNHPAFPGIEWDTRDWYVKNTAMVNTPGTSTLTGLFVKRIKGKPHFVTEYNHPFPNTFGAEGFLLLAAYASLQDWDMLIPFCYSSRSGDRDLRKIPAFFDIDQNPVALASFIPAAASFLRYDVKPAQEEISVPLAAAREADLLPSSQAWKLVDAESLGVPPLEGFRHRISMDISSGSPGIKPPDANNTGTRLVSDTGELVWDISEKSRGIFTANTNRSKIVCGFSAGRHFDLGNIAIEPGNTIQSGFSAIALTVIEGESFLQAKKIIITALGTQANTGTVWYRYPNTQISYPPVEGENVTLHADFGKAPSRVEGVDAIIVLPCSYDRLKVWALDSTGKRTTELTTEKAGGNSIVRIRREYEALWYEAECSD